MDSFRKLRIIKSLLFDQLVFHVKSVIFNLIRYPLMKLEKFNAFVFCLFENFRRIQLTKFLEEESRLIHYY